MYERLTLVLDPIEMAALKQAARQELRKPRDQVRHILRAALLHDPPDGQSQRNGESAVLVQSAGAAPLVQS